MTSINETNGHTPGPQILKTHGANIDRTLRKDIIDRVISGSISVNEASEFYGVFPSIIKLWAYGRTLPQSIKPGSAKSPGYDTPKDLRKKICKEIAEGHTTVESASDFYKIKKSTIQRWCDSYNYQRGMKSKPEVRVLIKDKPRMATIEECVRIARINPEIAGAILLKATSANRQIAELINAISKTL